MYPKERRSPTAPEIAGQFRADDPGLKPGCRRDWIHRSSRRGSGDDRFLLGVRARRGVPVLFFRSKNDGGREAQTR